MSDYFVTRHRLIEEQLLRLAEETASAGVLAEPLTRALHSPGKRVRGMLLMAAGEAVGCRAEKLAAPAAALEMIHTCSLILDDLPSMDDALLRRGEPSLHRAFGEDLAILSAVALLNHAYGIVVDAHASLAPRRWPVQAVVRRVVDAVGWEGTIAGEAADLHSSASTLDFDTLESIHSRKTGALFVAAAAVGAMLGNAHPSSLGRLEIYARNLGLAFQITDDILDVTSAPEVLGKDTGKDVERLTFVKLAGVEGARKLSNELVDTSLSAIEPLGKAAQPLVMLAGRVRDRIR